MPNAPLCLIPGVVAALILTACGDGATAASQSASHPRQAQVAALPGSPAESVLDESFDERTLSDFGKTLLAEDNIRLAPGEGVSGSNAIKVNYRGNERGSQRVIANHELPRASQYTLSFDVKFCPGFDFRKGGKLHGLGPANPVGGGNKVSPHRWSARAMFRPEGGLQSYIYSQNKKGKYGEVVIARDFRFEPGRYYALSYQVVLNDPASASNGSMKILVNGVPLIEHENIKFRSTESADSQISTLMFNTFHGGHTIDWAPRNADGSIKVDCAYFDNFTASPALEVRQAPGM